MEQLIKEFNDPMNPPPPGRVDDIQKCIQTLQREKSAWQKGLDLLQDEDATVRFYGALTLTIKINADWEADGVAENESSRQSLARGLLENYVRLTNAADETFVLRKVCSALTALFIRSTPEMLIPVAQVCLGFLRMNMLVESKTGDQILPESAFESISGLQLRGLLWLCVDLAEAVQRLDRSTPTWAILPLRLAETAQHVYLLIDVCLRRLQQPSCSNTLQNGHLLENPGNTENGRLAMSLIPLWRRYVPSESPTLLIHSIDQLLQCFERPDLASTVVETLTSLIDTRAKVLDQSHWDQLQRIVSSLQAREWVKCLLQGEFSHEAVNYVVFLIAMVENHDHHSSAYLARNHHLFDLMNILLALLSCKGAPVVEDEVCQMVMQCLAPVVEGYSEWEDKDSVEGEKTRRLILDICFAGVAKAQYPPEQMSVATQTWDHDDRLKFEDFRHDVQDVLDYAVVAFGPSFIQQLAEHIFASRDQMSWAEFEYGLSVLSSFSENQANESRDLDAMVDAVLQWRQQQWQMALRDVSLPLRVRQGVIRFLRQYTTYLEREVSQLVPSLEFLFSALSSPDTVFYAARAIRDLCTTKRGLLVAALPQFLTSLTVACTLESYEKRLIFGAVAAIIQALPSEPDKIGPLATMLGVVRSQHEQAQVSAGRLLEDRIASAVDTIRTLAAIAEDIRAPSNTIIDLESPENSLGDFWTAGPGQSIQEPALGLCITIVRQTEFGSNKELITAACQFFEAGYPESHPSPFKFLPQISADFLSSQIRPDSPAIEAVMDCASSFTTSSTQEALASTLPLLLTPISTTYQTTLSQSHTNAPQKSHLHDTDFASSSLNFLTRLLPKWPGAAWLSTPTATTSLPLTLEIMFLLLSQPDTLPRRTAAVFLSTLLSISGPYPSLPLPPSASNALTQVLHAYNPRIISSLLHLLAGECTRSEVDHLTEPLKSFIQHQPLPAHALLRQAIHPESGVLSERAQNATTPDQRLRFVAQLELLKGKGGKKTLEVVRQFWVACRGEAFGYITK